MYHTNINLVNIYCVLLVFVVLSWLMNCNVPVTKCFIRKEFMRQHLDGHGEFIEAYVFGVASLKSRPLLFHVHTVDGAKIVRLPLNALCWKPNPKTYEVRDVQLWDCLSGSVEAIEYSYFKNYCCKVKLGNNELVEGRYLFTLDNLPEGGLEETPDQHKDFNIIALDDGNFAAMPNNRILWVDTHFTKIEGVPDYKVIDKLYMVDNEQDLNFSESDDFFYEDNKQSNK